MSCLLQFQLRYCEIVYVSFQAEVDFLHICLHYILCSFVGRRIWESFYSLKSPIKGVCGLSNFLGKMWNVKCKEEVKKIAILFGKDTLLNHYQTQMPLKIVLIGNGCLFSDYNYRKILVSHHTHCSGSKTSLYVMIFSKAKRFSRDSLE